MKLGNFIAVCMLLAATVMGCKKESNSLGGSGNFTFKVDGAQVNSNVWNASWGQLVPATLTTNVTSNMHKEKRTVNININGVTTGTYNFVNGSTNTPNIAYGTYYPDYLGDLSTTYQFISGSFKITAIDTIAKTVSGTFSGTAKDFATAATVSITEGVVTNGQLVRF
jgi:hypothetical protein